MTSTEDQPKDSRIVENVAQHWLLDIGHSMALGIGFILIAIAFCTVNLIASASNGLLIPIDDYGVIEPVQQLITCILSTGFLIYMYWNRERLCDKNRRRRVDKFKIRFINFLSIGILYFTFFCFIALIIVDFNKLEIATVFFDIIFYLAVVIFLNLMNHQSFHENTSVRIMIGFVMATLVQHWLRVFFFPYPSCAEALDLEEDVVYALSILEEVSFVMVTEATIFSFEWFFILYGSIEKQDETTDDIIPEESTKKGKQTPVLTRILWHLPFAIFQAIRVAVLIVQVLKVKNVEDVGLWVYLSKSFGIVNDLVGYGCLIGIIYTLHKNHTKIVKPRRTETDEEDTLLHFASLAPYLITVYHLIEGLYFAINWYTNDGKACRALMTGEFQLAECYLLADQEPYHDDRENRAETTTSYNETWCEENMRQSRAEVEASPVFIDAELIDVYNIGVLYTINAVLEIGLLFSQVLVLVYLRRTKLILNVSRIKFWVLGMMYYNLSDWLSVAWIVETNPGVEPLDVCSGEYISSGLKHLILVVLLFYRFTAWRLWNESMSRALE